MKRIAAIVVLLAFVIVGCGAQVEPELLEFTNAPKVSDTYDVIVVGGEPEGVAAAVAAARNGLQTLLLEDDEALGGLMTLGKLNFIDMCQGRDSTLLTQGIFEEFYEAVDGSAFDITEAKNVFLTMVTNEPNLTLRLQAKSPQPLLEDNKITGITVQENGQAVTYTAKRVIDATVDADIAAASGVPYTFGGEDIGEKERQMGVTLVFELSDVDWTKVFWHLNWQRFKARTFQQGSADMGATKKMAWGYTEEGYGYEPKDDMLRLRGFNVAKQDNGNVLINALIIFGVDVLDDDSKAAGIARAKQELEYIVPYIRENFAGFSKAKLVGTAQQLYVRESRHIIGEYQLTIDDVLENRDQWDKIAIGSYPVDVQPTATQRYGTVIGSPDRYAVPFRSLVPLSVENLLVVGRSASYKSLAAGSARVIPLGMACGEAAGVASAYSVAHDMSFREMSKNQEAIASVQKTLKEQGAYLEDFSIHEAVMDHWAYEGVKVLRALGLLDGGYNNDYNLDVNLGRWRYQNMVNGVLKKAGVVTDYIEVNDDPPCRQIVGTMAREAAKLDGVKYENDYHVYLNALQERGIMTEELLPYFADGEKNPQAAETIMLVANFYRWLAAKNLPGAVVLE